jgi:K+-transporting ATPase ATPase C chain
MKLLRPATTLTALFVLAFGFVFPGLVWAFGQTLFSHQAAGSLVRDARGNVVGSRLLGQGFSRPEYFHPRPSAAGSGYDAASSGGTNLGPTSDKLINGAHDDPATTDVNESFVGIKDLAKAYREENGLPPDTELPADAVTRSGSGLDPDISPINAALQVARVARARHLPDEQVKHLVETHTEGRTLGVFGEPRVNVLEVNLALDQSSR